jgi:diacylglycerol kinase (ATP)
MAPLDLGTKIMGVYIIINPRAAGGKSLAAFRTIEARLKSAFDRVTIAITQTPGEIGKCLDAAAEAGAERLIIVGGDGTNHAVVNAIAERPGHSIPLGFIPAGTGTDWARALGMPRDPSAAVDWLAAAEPVRCDIGKVEYMDALSGGRQTKRVFLNIASAGVSGEVDARVNRASHRTALTFLRATLSTLFSYKPPLVRVDCDGHRFYEGASYLIAVANGRFFGRGMWIAPGSLINDGLFDVVLVEGMPRRRILLAFGTVFSGKHLRRKDIRWTRAASVRIWSEPGSIGLDLDGEEAKGQNLSFSVLPAALPILLRPGSSEVLQAN